MTHKWDDSHRPWPLPNLPWGMKQTWSELLFAHYPVPYEVLRQLVPEKLELDHFEGTYYIAVVPFQMSGVRLRGVPAIPGTNQFPELNIRTYVIVDGKPGVYFFSLEASNLLAVKGARTAFYLPYWHADMKLSKVNDKIFFESFRKSDPNVALSCIYEPTSKPFQPAKGSIEFWFVERYCLYVLNKKGDVLRCDILHEPWTIQTAKATFLHHTILNAQHIHIPLENPILHFAQKIEVRAWPLVDPFINRLNISFK